MIFAVIPNDRYGATVPAGDQHVNSRIVMIAALIMFVSLLSQTLRLSSSA